MEINLKTNASEEYCDICGISFTKWFKKQKPEPSGCGFPMGAYKTIGYIHICKDCSKKERNRKSAFHKIIDCLIDMKKLRLKLKKEKVLEVDE